MGFSPLADASRRIADRGRYNIRNSRIRGFTIHHNAGVDSYAEAWNPNREASANYWILNDGTILGNVDENHRAWTSGAAGYPEGAASDHRNITVEVSNSPEGVRNGTWAVSDAAMESLSALIGDVFKRHNLGPVRRATYDGVAVHQDFVPTLCPGPYIMGHLGSIISAAEAARTGVTPQPKPEEPTRKRKRKDKKVIFGVLKNGRSKGVHVYCTWTPGVKGSWWEMGASEDNGKSLETQLGKPLSLSRKAFNSTKAQFRA